MDTLVKRKVAVKEETERGGDEEQTCVKIALALEMRMRTAISFATKLLGIGTATQPASTMAKYAVTACTFMGMSIAMALPFLNPSSSRAFATCLHAKP